MRNRKTDAPGLTLLASLPPRESFALNDRPRIAFCITDLDVGGAERALVQLATRLHTSGWEARVFCLGAPGELVQPLESHDIQVVCLGARTRWAVSPLFRLTRELAQWRPALLQTFLFHANLAGRLAAAAARVPVVVSGLRVAERDAPWRMRCDRWTQRLVDSNVCVSAGVADFAIREMGLDPGKVRVIPNGVDFEQYAHAAPFQWEHLGIPGDSSVLLFVGRLHPQKAPEILLEATMPLFSARPDLHLVLVGEGPLRGDLERRIQESNWKSRIHLLGRRSDIPNLMRAARALVLPSRWEGMANVVLEAMAAGTPVVASDVEGTRELLTEGRTGYLCSPDSAPDLTAALERLFAEPGLASTREIESQQLAQKEFTHERSAQAYASLYRELLARGERVDK